jgi:thiamine biosynthesis lipoprotein
VSFTRPVVIVLLLALLGFIAIRHHTGANPQQVHQTRILMGTVVEITALGENPDHLQAAVTTAFKEMERIDRLMGPKGPHSDAVRVSEAEQSAEVSPETAKVAATGLQVARTSDGAFDMGLGRLKTLWGIESPHPRVPSPAAIRQALTGTGLGDLRVEGNRIFKRNAAIGLDLGGIAKGYAIDRAVAVLRRARVKYASVDAGGDIRLIGDHRGRPWRIGIQHPRHSDRLLATLSLQNTAVVTSGDYERFFIKNGVRYHHLFDPKTGYPARLSQSATVLAPNATLADALSTAAFVLGPKAGLALLERYPRVEGLIVGADGKSVWTPGLKGKITWP